MKNSQILLVFTCLSWLSLLGSPANSEDNPSTLALSKPVPLEARLIEAPNDTSEDTSELDADDPDADFDPFAELDSEVAEQLESLLELDLGQLTEINVTRFTGDRVVKGSGRQAAADSPAANVVQGEEATAKNTTDAGNLLGESSTNP